MHFSVSSELILKMRAMPSSSAASLAHTQPRLRTPQQLRPAISQALRQR